MPARILSVVVALAVLGSGTACADEPYDWAGWYAGIFGGYVNGELTSNDPAHFETTGEFDDNGFMFGIQGGYQTQNAKNWVFGAEVTIPLYLENGSAVDTEFFPEADPRVIYETDYKGALLVGGKAGKAFGKWLVYGCGAIGLAKNDGRTVNLDNDNNYSPGSAQVASATHLVYQLGGGGDLRLRKALSLGARILIFNSDQQQYEMPWNEGENNDFGMHSLLMQVQLNYMF